MALSNLLQSLTPGERVGERTDSSGEPDRKLDGKPEELEEVQTNPITEIPTESDVPKDIKDLDKKLQDLEKQTEKLAKSLQKLAAPKNINDLTIQLGITVRLGSDGKFKLVETPNSLHGKRVAGRLQSYIVSLNILQQKVREAQSKLARAETLTDEDIKNIKQIQSLDKPEEGLKDKAKTMWGQKEEEQSEFDSIVLLAKATSRAEERDPEKFESDKIIENLELDEQNLDEYNKDIEFERQILEDFKARFATLLLESTGDAEYVEQFFSRPEFAHVKLAIKKNLITLDDITDEDILELRESDRKKEQAGMYEDDQDVQAEADKFKITKELLGDSEESESFKNQLKEFAEITTSHDSSAVRARTELATNMLDKIVSRANHRNPSDESVIDEVFRELGLDTENVPQNRIRNYEEAQILKEAYKSIIRQRNEELLKQQEIRYKAVESKLLESERQSIGEEREPRPGEHARKIDEVINSSKHKDEADNALKQHFINDILSKTGNGNVISPDKVTIQFQNNGYYVLIVDDRETFNQLTGSTSDNTFGAAYKHGSVYIRLAHEEMTTKKGSKESERILPENDLVSEHEITHLKFDDERKVKIAREQYFHATKILNLVLQEYPQLEDNSDELFNELIDILGEPTEKRDEAIRTFASKRNISILNDAISQETSEFVSRPQRSELRYKGKSILELENYSNLLQSFDIRSLEAQENETDVVIQEFADKILDQVSKDHQLEDNEAQLIHNRISDILKMPTKARNQRISEISEQDPLYILKIATSDEAKKFITESKEWKPEDKETNKKQSTKLARLLKNYDERLLEIDYQNEEDNRYFQVEELAAELFGEFAEESTAEGSNERVLSKLDLSAIGLGRDDELDVTRITEHGGEEFIVNNVEAANMVRILNMASEKITNPEERLAYVRKWSRRIMQFEEFNQANTMLFIFELQNSDNIEINAQNYIQQNQGKEESIDKKENSINRLLTGQESSYLKLAERYKDGAFASLVRLMVNNGEFKNFRNNAELDKAIDKAFQQYTEIVNIGFDFSDLKTDKTRDVDNEFFKFASRPMYDGLIKMLNDMNVIGYPYSKAWPSGRNFVMEGLGLKVKDVTEKGLMIRRGKDRYGNTRWLFGRDATTMPVKYSSNLPLGLGEIRDRFLGIKDESFTSDEYVERLGVEHLDMDISEMFNLLQRGTAERLQESKYYISAEQVYFILDRIGLIHYHDGKPDMTYNSLAYENDNYLSKHLYMQTDANGKRLPSVTTGGKTTYTGITSKQGEIIYNRLVKNGFEGRDLHLLMEAHNPVQRMQRIDGSTYTVKTDEKPMRIGIVNMRLAERMKMMRFNYNKNDKDAERHIQEAEDFDEISKFIMDVNEDAFNAKPNSEYYTMTDLIKAIIDVDNIRPNDNDPNTTTLDKWAKAKETVTLTHNGKTITVNRKTLKMYTRCFFYAKTYEAMATGIYGNERVLQVNERTDPLDPTKISSVFYEIRQGGMPISKEEENQAIETIMSFKLSDAERNYNHNRSANLADFPAEWKDLTHNKKIEHLHNLRRNYAKQNYQIYLVVKDPDDLGFDPTVPTATTFDPYEIHDYKKLDKSIYFRPQGGYTNVEIEAHKGVKKSDMNTEFMDFKQHGGSSDPNAYSVGTIEGKLINKVEDVIGEKQTINYLYFYFRQLMTQADNYRKDASKNKEKWVGIARLNMLVRWMQTGLTLMALAGIGPAALGILLNPWVIVILLGNYFVLGNMLTRTGDLHGKRKVAAIKAVNELKQLEPNFEKALFDPNFSLGPERDRLFQLCKVAEDILKSALVTSVDSPTNVLQEVSKSLAETAKEFATGD